MAADDAAHERAPEPANPAAHDETGEPCKLTLTGTRTPAFEHHSAKAANDDAARHPEEHAGHRPTNGTALTTPHLEAPECRQGDGRAGGERAATGDVPQCEGVGLQSSDQAYDTG